MIKILAILATVAGVVMSLGHYPQAIKIFKRKSSRDVSLIAYSCFFIGVVIWLLYGISIKNIPLIVANAVGLVGCSSVILVYFIYGGGKSLIKKQAREKEENKKSILILLETQTPLTNNHIEQLLGISDATATRYLDELEKEGRVNQVGKTGRSVYYEKV